MGGSGRRFRVLDWRGGEGGQVGKAAAEVGYSSPGVSANATEEAEMARTARIGIVGDRDPGRVSHSAAEEAHAHAARSSGMVAEAEWLTTPSLEGQAAEAVGSYDAVLCTPGDYESSEGALGAIRAARESGTPLLGTCNGFQHAVIEFARNGVGAAHAETSPGASNLFIRPLFSSLVGKKMRSR